MPEKAASSLAIFENTTKSYEASLKELSNQTKAFGDQFKALLDGVMKQFTTTTDRVIQTDFLVEGSKKQYKTTINSISGNITSDLSSAPTSEEEIYWKLHMKLVDEALATRKELQLKIVETVGATVKGLFNPVSISNIDLVQIIQAMFASTK